ncbi:MAG: TonB-dependent receptor [Halioglobus sp.]|nr:TonB-dependent receptor [Halioglobus sp.]
MKNQRLFRKNTLAAAVAASVPLLYHAQPGLAQPPAALEEVIVTATARQQAVEDIPYNISAMQGSELVDQQINDQAELLRAMSGVSVVDRGYRNSGTVNSIIIRGINVDNGLNGDISLNAVPTVATYVDNTPVFANFVLRDLERAEVLRGPQGTLYGSGSLGGTVRYITNKPDMEALEGEVRADYSQTEGSDGDNYDLYGMINIPVTERIAVRGFYNHIENDGVIDYVNAYQLNSFGEPLIATEGGCVDPREASDAQVLNNGACYRNKEDADDVEIDLGRIAVQFDATDTFSVLGSFQRQEDKVGARRATTLGDNNQPEDGTYFEYDDLESGQVLLEPSERTADLYALDMSWDLGFATLTSNTSYFDTSGEGDSDNGGLWVSGGEVDPDASRDWIAAFGYAGWPRPAQRAERGYDTDTWVQEFRLVSNETVNNMDWLAGVFYLDEDQTVYQNSWNPGMNVFNESCRATGSPVCDNFWPRFYDGLTERDFEYRRDVETTDIAIYGELTYHLSEALRVTGGVRWFEVESENDTIMGFPLVVGWTSDPVPSSDGSDNDVLGKLNVSYDVSDSAMVYATWSQGYRRGGYNAVPSLENGDNFGEPNAEAIRSYDSDSADNYEIGVKGRNDFIAYTVSLFYVDWQDPQLNTTSDWYGFFIAQNGDEASSKGLELEATGYVTDNLRYRVGYTYVKAELEKDLISAQQGGVIADSGNTLPGTPENVLSFSIDHTLNLDQGMDLVSRVGGYYQSESENYIDNDSLQGEEFDSFWLWNASATLFKDNWRFVLYGKNLGDEDGVTGSFPSSYWSYDTGVFESWYGNGNRQMITQPRTVGLSVSYAF